MPPPHTSQNAGGCAPPSKTRARRRARTLTLDFVHERETDAQKSECPVECKREALMQQLRKPTGKAREPLRRKCRTMGTRSVLELLLPLPNVQTQNS